MRTILISTLLILTGLTLYAQPPGGGRDFSNRVKAEKDSVLVRITDLSADQKLIIESIYQDYESSLAELTANRSSDRQGFRDKLQESSEEKDQLIKEVLTDSQLSIYDQLMADNLKRRQDARQNRRGGRKGRNKAQDGNKK